MRRSFIYILGTVAFLLLFSLLLPKFREPQVQPSDRTKVVPHFDHVVVVMGENKNYSDIVGSSSAPTFNRLLPNGALATNFYASTHPSIGNYFMLIMGSTVTNDDKFQRTLTQDSLVRILQESGATWKSYIQGMPYAGYLGDDSDAYIQHHNPMSYLSDVRESREQMLSMVPIEEFSSDVLKGILPTFSLVVPDNQHNGHDCGSAPSGCSESDKLKNFDAWIAKNIVPLLQQPLLRDHALVILTWDEARTSDARNGGGRIPVLFLGKGVAAGKQFESFAQFEHLLRTIVDALGLPRAPGAAAMAAPMAEAFRAVDQK